ARVPQNFRPRDVRRVVILMMVVVLDERQRLPERRTGNERRSDPVMNHPARTFDSLAVVERLEPLDHHVALAQLRVRGRATLFHQPLDPQETPLPIRQLRIDLRFRQLRVTLKRLHRPRLKLRRARRQRQSEHETRDQGHRDRRRDALRWPVRFSRHTTLPSLTTSFAATRSPTESITLGARHVEQACSRTQSSCQTMPHCEGRLDLAASGRPVPLRGSGGINRRGWTGWVACPAPLGTVVPASPAPTPANLSLTNRPRQNNGPRGSKSGYARFSTT